MSEREAMILVALSHKWVDLWLPLPFVFCILTFYVRRRERREIPEDRRGKFRKARMASQALLAASCVLFVVGFLHIGCAVVVAHTIQCMSNMKQLGMSMQLYMQDYDERLPACAIWERAVASRLGKAAQVDESKPADPFRCPAAESPASYGMNSALNAVKEVDADSPAETVLLFDADAPTRSFAGGPHDLARSRHDDMPNVTLLDGHAKSANRYTENGLNWALKAPQDQGP